MGVWSKRILWLAFVGVAVAVSWHFRVHALLHYAALSLGVKEPTRTALSVLRDHHVQLEAKPIAGVDRNLSGLTFSRYTQTLFGVVNRPPAVVEIDTNGVWLRTIPLAGFHDTEGISHVRDDWFVISDERHHRLHWVQLGVAVTEVDASQTISMQLPLLPRSNLGVEGVSWDDAQGRLVLVQEQWPQRVWVLQGLDQMPEGRLSRLDIATWQRPRWLDIVTADLSSVTVHEPTGQWFFLSAASGLVVQYDESGRLVDTFPLWRSFRGLTHSIPQAEGMTFDDQGRLFIVSEPNLFYRFGPP